MTAGAPAGDALEIRNARPDERGALEDLQRRASGVWPETREQLAEHPELIDVDPAAIAAHRVRVAVDPEGRVLGFSVVLPPHHGTLELDGLFVEPQAMGRGVGRKLVDNAVVLGRLAGALRLEVVSNTGAEGFYARLGFVPAGRASTLFGDARRMAMDL